MKQALTSFDLRVLVGELSQLEGSYLDKVYQMDSSFIFRFNIPRVGRREVYVEPGRWIFLGQDLEKPPEPPTFAQDMRRALDNAVLRRVMQRGFDRIIVLEFEKEARYSVVLEMFGGGNLILLKEGEVMRALRYGTWRTREIRRGKPYGFPPEGINPEELTEKEFREVLASLKGQVVKGLASGLNLGGLYAEELCLRAGIPKTQPVVDLDEGQLGRLYKELEGLFRQLEAPTPAIIVEEEPVDVVPFDLRLYQGYEVKRFKTFSEALQQFLGSLKPKATEDQQVAKIERRIGKQEEVLREVEEEIHRMERAAEYLYAHYQHVQRLLTEAREGRGPGGNLDRDVVSLEFDGMEVDLRPSLSVDENARLLYERKKELAQRARRVRQALEESRAELERARRAERRPEVLRAAFKPSKRFWFDAYRWSVSSEGFLILAGRDARSNERLVRRHLEPGDRYVHAELPGAPSVVVKEGSKAGVKTLEEACRLAVVYSKAWSLGLGSGTAYWVTPEQVSKTAESGEYLRRGAFVIRGKRNYIHNIPLALGIGEIIYQSVRRVAAADPDAMEGMSQSYVILQPAGKVERKDLAHLLSDAFQVPLDEVERLLPPGTFHVAKVKGLAVSLPEA